MLTRYILILNLFLPMMVDFLGDLIIALGYKYHQDTKFLYAHNQKDIEHSCIAIQLLYFTPKSLVRPKRDPIMSNCGSSLGLGTVSNFQH